MGLVYEEDLVGDYAVWATDTMEDAAIVRKGTEPTTADVVVPRMVFAYGWNDDYIIAKQHPGKGYYEVDKGTTHWYVIEVLTGKVHGPLGEDEFQDLQVDLGIPVQIPLNTLQGSQGG